MIKAGLLGIGTIGRGVYELLVDRRVCPDVEVTKVLVKNRNKPRPGIKTDLLVYDDSDILDDPEIKIIIDITGDYQHSYTTIKKALEANKHVITANKEVVAGHLRELTNLAKRNKVAFFFEASVGGGIPIISSLTEVIRTNKVNRICGILNGTTNFILSKMQHDSMKLGEAITQAIQLGFAEPDPTADLCGFDVVRKVCILSMIAYGGMIPSQQIYRYGIESMTDDDVRFILEHGYALKLVATSVFDKTVDIRVEPALLPQNQQLVTVQDEYNIISIDGDICGKLDFLGKGAGTYATANSVVADLWRILDHRYEYLHVERDYQVNIQNDTSLYYIRQNDKQYFKELTRSEFEELGKVDFYAKALGGKE